VWFRTKDEDENDGFTLLRTRLILNGTKRSSLSYEHGQNAAAVSKRSSRPSVPVDKWRLPRVLCRSLGRLWRPASQKVSILYQSCLNGVQNYATQRSTLPYSVSFFISIMESLKVIIVGAGLFGSLLANGLMREGIQVTVYERQPRRTKREGYQIRLGYNALVGFRACLDQLLIDIIVGKLGRTGGLLASAPVIHDKSFKVLLDPGQFESYTKSAPINRVLLRDILTDPVFEAGHLHYDKPFQRYEIIEESGRERVRAWFEDGTSDVCDILVGADGSHSRVRIHS